jgi:hypothetical protein
MIFSGRESRITIVNYWQVRPFLFFWQFSQEEKNWKTNFCKKVENFGRNIGPRWKAPFECHWNQWKLVDLCLTEEPWLTCNFLFIPENSFPFFPGIKKRNFWLNGTRFFPSKSSAEYWTQSRRSLSSWLGTDVMITIFCDFWQFSAIFDNFRRKNWRFSQKPMLWSIFLKKITFVFSQKRHFFRRISRRKNLNNHNIGPWYMGV